MPANKLYNYRPCPYCGDKAMVCHCQTKSKPEGVWRATATAIIAFVLIAAVVVLGSFAL